MIYIIVLMVPWEELYKMSWYKEFIEYMSAISPNIYGITKTDNQFPEYAIAYVGFMNFIGPFVLLYSASYSRSHGYRLTRVLSGKISAVSVVWLSLGYIIMLLAMLIASYSFTGRVAFFSEIFLSSKASFVGLHLSFWWAANICMLGALSLLFALYYRIKV